MYKHAATRKPASQEGYAKPRYSYAVMAFYLRPDNQGNPRLFRNYNPYSKLKDAEKFYSRKLNGKHLYVALVRLSDMQAIREQGDPAIEDNWLETNQG